MRKLTTILLYTTLVLFIGRNLPFLPRVYFTGNQQAESETLKKNILRTLKNAKGNYSVSFHSFTSKHLAGINEKEVYTGGSVNKVQIIAALYHLANIGAINLEENVTLRKEDIQDYGTGSLRYQESGGVYSLKTLAKLSLQQSDNTAVKLIATKIGMDKIQKIVNGWGLSQTDMANNKTSLADMQRLFEKIYKREVASDALTKELLSFMTDTDIEDRLPALLPKSARVYHKTGDILGGIHDVGIVEYDGIVFFIGVMTRDVGNNEQEVRRTIATIAKTVFDFEQRYK